VRTRFFTLRSLVEDSAATAPERARGALGVGPVTLPEYLRRTQLVTRIGPSEVRLSHDAVWSEPLGSGVTRTLAMNLATLVEPERVLVYPWDPRFPPEQAVAVDLIRFERQAAPEVELLARWSVRRKATGAVTLHETRLHEPVASDDPAATVDALGRALGSLSREIARALTRD
jgi:uncharacterized lipoprotein YmbA